MLYNKNNFAIYANAAGKASNHPELQGVYITPDETVVTDTFTLICVSTPKGQDVKDFPQPPDGQEIKARKVHTIIPSSVAKSVMSKIKLNQTLPILEHAIIKGFQKEERITFASTDLETWDETTANVVEGKFPEYKDIIPKEKPQAKVCVNIGYLSSVLSALARTTSHLNDVEIELHGADKPIVLRTSNENQKTLALVMPIRKED